MKRIISIVSAVVVAAVFFMSCDIISGGAKMTDQARVDKFPKMFAEMTGSEEAKIYNISFVAADPFNFASEVVTVYYTEPGDTEIKGMTRNFKVNQDSPDRATGLYSKKKPEQAIELNQINFSQIPEFIEKGKTMMEEGDIKCSGLHTYTIKIDSSDPSAIVHEFELSEKGATKATGRGTETTYYTYKFRGYTDGTVEYIDK